MATLKQELLLCETPQAWVDSALQNQDLLLIDHAHCEKKAAGNAISIISRYPQHASLMQKLSRIAREELRHFEMVIALLAKRQIKFISLSGSRYFKVLLQSAYSHDPARLVDSLIICAFIEARSCERFGKIAPYLDDKLKDFYQSLLQAEARHAADYLMLAKQYTDQSLEPRIHYFAKIEQDLILSPDTEFRFHSGMPG
jgi:tRNA-(ms[2]io[6]A)-hydroxylase